MLTRFQKVAQIYCFDQGITTSDVLYNRINGEHPSPALQRAYDLWGIHTVWVVVVLDDDYVDLGDSDSDSDIVFVV